MTNTVGIIVLLSTTACSPLMARNAKPTPGKNVNPKPTPKPIDRPFLSFPSSLTLPSSMMFCPSTAFVETHFTATDPGFPHPRAFCLSTLSHPHFSHRFRLLPRGCLLLCLSLAKRFSRTMPFLGSMELMPKQKGSSSKQPKPLLHTFLPYCCICVLQSPKGRFIHNKSVRTVSGLSVNQASRIASKMDKQQQLTP